MSEMENNFERKFSNIAWKLGSAGLSKLKINLQIGFSGHLDRTFRRCYSYKSVLNSNVSCILVDTYVNVRMTCAEEIIKDDNIIDKFINGEKYIVTGLAGSGKSMFMKYLSMKIFELDNMYPLFIELRKFNGRSGDRLEDYILQECNPEGSALTKKEFLSAVRAGLFALVLDGFDELEQDSKRLFCDKINDFVESYPSCPLIISSRPDSDAFMRWTHFRVASIQHLNMEEFSLLIQKIPYDDGVKSRFLSSVLNGGMIKQQSFLKYPLMALIMMMTFESFGDFRGKIHEFFSMAFDTLFKKHDADKQQFVRKTKSDLSNEDFKRLTSAFCALSYANEKFEFSNVTVISLAEQAIEYTKNISPGLEVRPHAYVDDLVDAVCLLQRDGSTYEFVHRSFQEYFTALFFHHLSGDQSKSFMDKVISRRGDDVFRMAVDLHRNKIEEFWVNPRLGDILDVANKAVESQSPLVFYRYLARKAYIVCDKDSGNDEFSVKILVAAGRQVNFGSWAAIVDEYGERISPYRICSFSGAELSDLKEWLEEFFLESEGTLETIQEALRCQEEEEEYFHVAKLSNSDDFWLTKCGAMDKIAKVVSELTAIQGDISERVRSQAISFDNMF
jgi:hypothetical protein